MPVNWTSTRDILVSMNGLSGVDALNRDAAVRTLNSAGNMWEAARTAVGAAAVDAAYDQGQADAAARLSAWQASAGAVHAQADKFAKYLLGDGVSVAFASDGSALSALEKRLSAAEPKAKALGLFFELQNHRDAVTRTYARKPSGVTYPAPFSTPTPLLGAYLRPRGLNHSFATYLLAVLQPAIDHANALLAELTS